MIADTARISKLEYAYETPSDYSDVYSLKMPQRTNLNSLLSTGGTIRDNIANITNNISYGFAGWFKMIPSPTANHWAIPFVGAGNLHRDMGWFNFRFGNSGPSLGFATFRSDGAVQRWNYLYSFNAGTVPDSHKTMSDWAFYAVSIYKTSYDSTQILGDFWANNSFIGTTSRTNSSFPLISIPSSVGVYNALGSPRPIGKDIYCSQSAFYYSTNGSKFTQSDINSLYNAGVPSDWSSGTLGDMTLVSNYICGDSANDDISTPLIEDQSSNNFHLTSLSSVGNTATIVTDAP